MMGSISEALISLIPEKISDTAPGRTPMAAARPPLDLPVFFNPRSIILASMYMMTSPFRFSIHSEFHKEINAVFQKNHLTMYSVYRNRGRGWWRTRQKRERYGGTSRLAVLALRGAEGICDAGNVVQGRRARR